MAKPLLDDELWERVALYLSHSVGLTTTRTQK
jgi:hypothetical protein